MESNHVACSGFKLRRFTTIVDTGNRAHARVLTDYGVVCVDMTSMPKAAKSRIGKCYELSGKFQLDNNEWTLVHAMLNPQFGPFANCLYDHAFVEHEALVFDPVFAEFYPKDEYYACYRTGEANRHDYMSSARMITSEGHWGPWGRS